MRPMMKPILTLCLCLTMLITSATGAFARGQMAFGQTLQLCSESGAGSITVDAQGNPVNVTCPECFALSWGLPPESNAVVPPFPQEMPALSLALVFRMGHGPLGPQARGPPAAI